MQIAPTYQEVPTPILEGWLYTLQSSQTEMTEHEVILLKEKRGVYIQTPKKSPTLDYLHRQLLYLLQTDNDSCTYKETSVLLKLKAFI